MKQFITLLLSLLYLPLSAFEITTPIPAATIKQVEIGPTYYQDISENAPLETPIDTIDLGKYGTLYLVLVDQVTIMEDEGISLLLFHQSPTGDSLVVGPSTSEWGCDTITDTLASADSVFGWRDYDFNEGSWADTTSAQFFPLWEYSHELWNVEDPYEEYLLWGKATLLIEAKDGSWLKFRFTKEHFQYSTTDSETGDFPHNRNFLGETIPLRFMDSRSDTKIVPHAFDSVTGRSLLFLNKQWSYTVPAAESLIISRSGDIWKTKVDTSAGIYSFVYGGSIDMDMSWMDAYHHIGMNDYPYFAFGMYNQIEIDSLSRDSLWGINEKCIPEGRTVHEVSVLDTIAIALGDTVFTSADWWDNDTLNYYALSDLFIGVDSNKKQVNFVKVHLITDEKVSNLVEKSNTHNLTQHIPQKIQLISTSGRVLRECTSSYSSLPATLQSFALPSGIYLVKTPHFIEKVRMR